MTATPDQDHAEAQAAEVLDAQPADEAEAAEDAGQQASFEDFLDLVEGLPPGVLGSGEYTLHKTPDGTLLLVYRPDHTGADCHFAIPPSLLSMARFMSKGPLGYIARRQARKALTQAPE